MKIKMLVIGLSLMIFCNIFVSATIITTTDINTSNVNYDYILITSQEFKNYAGNNSFHDLCAYHEQEGLKTNIETVEYIENCYSGNSREEKILNYIKAKRPEYVLLGGDCATIPGVNLMCRPDDHYLRPTPSDLYYSCPNVIWVNEPEKFKPVDKDLSQDDDCLPGYSLIGGGLFNGYGEETDYGEMKWTYAVGEKNRHGWCNISFNEPADLSDMDYMYFNIKANLKEYALDENGNVGPSGIAWSGIQIIFIDSAGKSTDMDGNYKNPILFIPNIVRTGHNSLEWEHFNAGFQYKYGVSTLDYSEITQISFKISRYFTGNYNITEVELNSGDYILIDELYFSDYTSKGYTLKTGEMKPTICIGRASVDNIDDIQNFVGKTLRYVNSNLPDDKYLKNVMLVDSHCGGNDQGTNKLNELESKYLNTVGYTSNKYFCNDAAARDNLFNADNTGILIYMGHGTWDGYQMGIFNSNIGNFKNKNPFFEYSTGCNVGAFDKVDCYAEHLTVKTTNGAFAGLWHTRTSWSSYYHASNYFWQAICHWNYTIGQAHRYQLQRVGGSGRFTHTLFGDPAVNIKLPNPSGTPEKPTTPEGKTNIVKGKEQCYTTKSTDPNGKQVTYGWDWDGDGTVNQWTDFYDSGVSIKSCRLWMSEGTYEIRVQAKNVDGLESEWSDPLRITVQKSKDKFLSLFNNLIARFLDNHPKMFPFFKLFRA